MTYLPLARKYRPQTFDALIGQPHVTTTLTRSLESGRLGQAYLFTGLRGVGKTSAARILAKALNCANGPTANPCNQCPSCTQITQGNSLDVVEIDGASNRGIDEIRNLRETVPYAPTSGPFRVYIIDEVHMLTTEAFNALLKTLEEPPAHVKFIFATTAPNKVPSTILSRCQRFDFRRLESATIVQTLQRVAKAEKLQIDEPALYAIARASDGSLRDAEVVLEQLSSFVKGAIVEADVTALLGAIASDALIDWTQAILEHNTPTALSLLLEQLEQGKDVPQLLTGLLRHIRNLLILRSIAEAPSRAALITRLIDEPADRLQRLETQAQHTSAEELLLFLQMLTGAYELIRRSPMAQTILELVVIKLCTREQWQSLDEISQRLERLRTAPGSTPPVMILTPSSPTSSGRPQPAARSVSPAAAQPSEDVGQPVAPSATSTMMPQECSEIWPMFLERLGKQKMSLAAYLTDARPMQLDGGTLTVGLPGFALHQEVLSVTENRRLIERLLRELCQRAISVQYETLPPSSEPSTASSAAAPASSTPPIVQDIVQLFNATILDQPRPT